MHLLHWDRTWTIYESVRTGHRWRNCGFIPEYGPIGLLQYDPSPAPISILFVGGNQKKWSQGLYRYDKESLSDWDFLLEECLLMPVEGDLESQDSFCGQNALFERSEKGEQMEAGIWLTGR